MCKIDLYNDNCLDVMDSLIKKNIIVDAIITDIPYGTTGCRWDSVIPFDEMWTRLNKLIKDDGAIVLFGAEPFSSALRMSNIGMYKYDWTWLKDNVTGHLNAKHRPLKSHELISVFSKKEARAKGDNMCYYPQGLIEVNKKVKEKRKDKKLDHNYFRESVNGKEYVQQYSNYPNMLLEYAQEKNRVHPTQKPIKLMEYLVSTYTKENELVLDFTMGSGATMIACDNLSRNGIGVDNGVCEKDKIINNIQLKGLSWAEITRMRLDKKI